MFNTSHERVRVLRLEITIHKIVPRILVMLAVAKVKIGVVIQKNSRFTRGDKTSSSVAVK